MLASSIEKKTSSNKDVGSEWTFRMILSYIISEHLDDILTLFYL